MGVLFVSMSVLESSPSQLFSFDSHRFAVRTIVSHSLTGVEVSFGLRTTGEDDDEDGGADDEDDADEEDVDDAMGWRTSGGRLPNRAGHETSATSSSRIASHRIRSNLMLIYAI